MSVDAAAFRRALGQFATGVTVVLTRAADGRRLGLTANAFCSVSLEPPMVLVCVGRRSEAHAGFVESGRFGVSVLAEGQEDVSRRFAARGPERFEGFELEEGPHGSPLVPGALARLECRVTAAHEAGDHVIYVGEVLAADSAPGAPLVYHASGYVRLASGEEGGGAPRDRV
jgi:flavin reductase (DIM6/NTAB) family NADH-FMN oxidoreductase RutF